MKPNALVDFQTAQELKAIGFDSPTSPYFDKKGTLKGPRGVVLLKTFNNNRGYSFFSAPKWDTAARWLRFQGYYIQVSLTPDYKFNLDIASREPYLVRNYGIYSNYKEAIIQGVKEAINIIKQK